MRLIRDWTIAFAGDERIDNTECRPRNHHDVHEPADHIEVAVVMIAPSLVDGADPVLQRAGDRFDVMVFRFGHVDDHVRIEHLLFDGALSPIRGSLHPDLSRPGLGLEFKQADAQRYAL